MNTYIELESESDLKEREELYFHFVSEALLVVFGGLLFI
jgi:hypothetical protein